MITQNNEPTLEEIISYYLDRWESSSYIDDLSGGFEKRPEDFKKILEEIQQLAKKDPSFGALTVGNLTNDDGIRAATFIDKLGNVTIAFRGTGGIYDSWRDNLQGAGVTDTEMQEAALKYVERLIKRFGYTNISLTGHSKGENLAHYVAIILGERILRSVGFSGQWYSKFFINEYEAEIAANKHKITSIKGHKDIVGSFMFPIIDRIFYVETGEGGMHDPDNLYFSSEFDALGRIINKNAEQNYWTNLLGDSIRVYLNNLPQAESELASEVLGLLLAPFMSKDFDLFTVEGFIETLQEGISAAREYISNSKVGPLAGIRAKWAFRFALTSTLSHALAGLAKDGLITLGKGIADGAKGIASAIQNHFIRNPKEAEQLVSILMETLTKGESTLQISQYIITLLGGNLTPENRVTLSKLLETIGTQPQTELNQMRSLIALREILLKEGLLSYYLEEEIDKRIRQIGESAWQRYDDARNKQYTFISREVILCA